MARRAREIGIRVALGARRREVIWQTLREGLIVAVPGLIIGVVMAAASTRLLAPFVFGVTADDPVRLVIVSLALLLTVSAAALLPARRAATLDPMISLRAE